MSGSRHCSSSPSTSSCCRRWSWSSPDEAAMSPADTTSEHAKVVDLPDRAPPATAPTRPRLSKVLRIVPVLITLATTAVAIVLGWAMWDAYMGAPWTRDGTVRNYVVTMAPEVAGRIVELPVRDNQLVQKGDVLLVIEPPDYQIAVRLAEAAVQQAQANAQIIDAQITVQEAQIAASQALVAQAQAAVTFPQEQAARYKDLAQREYGTVQMEQQTASNLLKDQAALRNEQADLTLPQRQIASLKAQRASAEATIAQASATRDQAKVNLERTQIRAPVAGWVTNLLAQLGDYVTVGKNVISLVDADSFWVDAYFEETALGSIREGNPPKAKLRGDGQIVRDEVRNIAPPTT